MKKNAVLLVGIFAALAWLVWTVWMIAGNWSILAALGVVFVLGACTALTLQKA